MSAFHNANEKKPLQLIFPEEVAFTYSFVKSKRRLNASVKKKNRNFLFNFFVSIWYNYIESTRRDEMEFYSQFSF